MAPLPMPLNDLQGHCWLKPLCPSAAVVRVHDDALAE